MEYDAPAGSSPLARGTRLGQCRRCGRTRFIPAGAGNTRAWWCRSGHRAVHPRWRGEHDTRAANARHTIRFIPAGAGNTGRAGHSRCRRPVHPRWRGEHPQSEAPHRHTCGSSPLARGTRGSARDALPSGRFIPAGAGNTSTWRAETALGSVHPRWRGEHARSLPASASQRGSSPLARGTRLGVDDANPIVRFIPAGAGNTLSLTNCSQRRKSAAKNLPTSPC